MALASAAYPSAAFLVQWSPLLLAGLISGLGFLWAAKPTIGAALFAGWPSRSAAMIAGRWPYWLVLVYLPALVMVLRRRH